MGYASKNAKKHNDRISDQEKVYHCAYCKGVVLKTDHYCQYCGKKLKKQSFFGCFAHYINEKLAKRFPNKRDGRVLLLSILGSDMSLYTDYRKDKEKRQAGR